MSNIRLFSVVVLIYPIVALILSTLFEGYEWHLEAFMGAAILLLGIAVAMGKLPLPFSKGAQKA